jgi:hypothetical protein
MSTIDEFMARPLASGAAQNNNDRLNELMSRPLAPSQTETLDLALKRAAVANPALTQSRQTQSQQLGVSPAALPNPSQAELEIFRKAHPAGSTFQRSPASSRFLMTGQNADLVGKDFGSLTEIESKYLKEGGSNKRVLDLVKHGLGLAAAAAHESAGAGGSTLQTIGDFAKYVTTPLSEASGLPDFGKSLSDFGGDYEQGRTAAATRARPPKTGNFWQDAVDSGLESAATAGLTAPLVLMGGGAKAMAGGFAALEFGKSLKKGRDEGLGPFRRTIYAGQQSAVEYLTELIPAVALLDNLGKGAVKAAISFMAKEVPGEQVATFLQDLNEWLTLNPTKTLGEFAAERPGAAAMTFVSTLVGGGAQVGGASAINSAMNKVIDYQQKARVQAYLAERGKGYLTEFGQQAGSNPVRARSPDLFKQFAQTMSEDGHISDVYIAPAKFEEALQQAGVTDAEIARKMPDVARELAIARASTADVRISFADWATHFAGTPIEVSIIDNLKVSPEPDAMTYIQSQEFYQNEQQKLSDQATQILASQENVMTKEEFLAEQKATPAPEGTVKITYDEYKSAHKNQAAVYSADLKTVTDTIAMEMSKAGRFTNPVNVANAIPLREFYVVHAAKHGIMPSEMYARYPIKFRSEALQGAALNQDTTTETTDPALSLEEHISHHILLTERGDRVTGEKAIVSLAERSKINAAKKALGFEDTDNRIITQILKHKLSNPIADGWAKIEVSKITVIKGKNGKEGKFKLAYKTVPYTFAKNRKGALRKGSKEYASRVTSLAKSMRDEVLEIYKRALAGDVAAKNIIRQAGWYKEMRTRLRHEFGGLGDVFADLLGASSPNTPVRENWKNAVDLLRRASRGDFDLLMPKWVEWSDKLDAAETDFSAWFGDKFASGMSKKAIKASDEYIRRKKELSALQKLDDALLPTKEHGPKYGFNGKNAVRALLNLWRSVKNADTNIGIGGTAPKALNFSGNLIGFREGATIDVWAARLLQRLSGGYRIPSMAEGGVTGSMLRSGETTGMFGFGQDVFDAAAKLIRTDPEMSKDAKLAALNTDDLQAVVWFLEKEVWTKNDWTSAAGEGGSFEYESDLTGQPDLKEVKKLRKVVDSSKSSREQKIAAQQSLNKLIRTMDGFHGGISLETTLEMNGVDYVPTDSAMAQLAGRLKTAAYEADKDNHVLASKLLSTVGLYGSIDRSIDLELMTRAGYDANTLFRQMLIEARDGNQDVTFLSRKLRHGEENTVDPLRHRPGVEVFFKDSGSLVHLQPILDEIAKQGIPFYTVIVDGKRSPSAIAGAMPAAVGIRFQLVPEMMERFNSGNVKWSQLNDAEIIVSVESERLRLDASADAISKIPGVSSARQFWYDTEVVFKDKFEERINEITIGLSAGVNSASGENHHWTGKSISEGVKRAASWRDTSNRAASGEGRVPPGDGVLHQSTFFSALEREIGGLQKIADKNGLIQPAQVKAWITARSKEGKFKQEEIEAIGLMDWLDLQKEKVSTAAVEQFVHDNGVQIEEVMWGAPQPKRPVGTPSPVHYKDMTNSDEVKEYFPDGIETPDGFPATEVHDYSFPPIRLLNRTPGQEAATRNFNAFKVVNQNNPNGIYELYDDGERQIGQFQSLDEVMQHVEGFAPYIPDSGLGDWGKIIAVQPEHEAWTLKGGTDYRELMLTLPGDEVFSVFGHFRGQPNILASIRFKTRADDAGKKVLFIEEIQSDWGQQGKKKGFDDVDELNRLEGELQKARAAYDAEAAMIAAMSTEDRRGNPFTKLQELAQSRADANDAYMKERGEGRAIKIPAAPFVQDTKSWTSLAFKRILRYAAENGFDKIAWTTGEQQAERYDLSTQIGQAAAVANKDGTYNLTLEDMNRVELAPYSQWGKKVTALEMEAVIGKDLTKKLTEGADRKKDKPWPKNVKKNPAFFVVRGFDLKVGGDGMKGFYDKILPQVVNGILKKLDGGKVGESIVEMEEEDQWLGKQREWMQQSVTITPALRAKVMEGLPLFQPDSRASFSPQNLTISLLKGSDLSSVIHESGHFYLHALAEMASRPGAPQQVQDDFRTTLKWFGLPEGQVWTGMTLDQQRPYHEQWAQSFERYAIEGKAPSLEMQPVFARFRAWMLNVYQSVQEFLAKNPLAEKLNDDVRGVFDRMLASEKAINEATQARSYAPLFTTAKEAGVTQEAFDQYIDDGKNSTEQALDKLAARSLKDMQWASTAHDAALKSLQAEVEDKRSVIRSEVAAEVMAEPVNQARKFLKTGETVGPNGEEIKAVIGFKLNLGDVNTLFPSTGLIDLDMTKLRGMTSEDGISPELAAQMFGFSSGSTLVLELMDAPPAAEKIQALTDQRMLENYGELISPEALKAAASLAVHNEARAKFMATGLKMLMASPIPASQLNKAAQQAAESAVALKKVRDLHPIQYERAESRAGKDAIAQAAKDPASAIKSQREALLNNRLAKASLEAQAEVAKALKYISKFSKPGTRKNLTMEYMEQIDALLSPFDLHKSTTLKQIDLNSSLSEWVAAQEAQGFEPYFDPDLINELKRKHYKDMTVQELRGLIDAIKQIDHMGRMSQKLLTAQDERTFQAHVLDADESIRANANRTVKERGTPSDMIGMTGRWFRQMLAAHRKFNSIMREMDGSKDNGVMWNMLARTMNESGDNETEMKQSATNAIAALFMKLPKDSAIGNIYAKKMIVTQSRIAMTQEQRVMFALNWGNAGNRQRLMDGGIAGRRITEIDAENILDSLTHEQWEFVQGVLDYIGSYKDAVSALERKLTGVEPKWIEATPIVTKFGTYKGGYFPAKYDAELSTRSESLDAVNDLRSAMKGAIGASTTRSGFTKERAPAIMNRPILLSYNVISQHISEVTHRLSWQPWLIDANRTLKALDAVVREHYGPDILRELRDTVMDIATGDAPAKNPTEAAINRLRIGSTIVGLGWRVTTALLQPSGLAQSWVRVGGPWIAKGVASFIASPLASGDFVNSRSKLMVSRGITMQREINEVLNTVRSGEKISAIQASYFTMIGKMQRVVDIPTWLGAYEKGLAQMKYENAPNADARVAIEKQAAALADSAVIDSQSGGMVKDLAKVQRGSPIMKIFTNFYSYFSATYNLNVEAVRRTNFKSPVEVGLLAVDMMIMNSIPVLFAVALKELLKGECDQDLECLANKLGHEQLSFLFGQMILLREVGTAVDAATGGAGFGYSGPAGLRFFSDMYKLGQQTNQGDADLAAFKAANSVAGALLHYPAGQVNATVEGIMAVEDGRVDGVSILPALIVGPPRK